MGSPMKYVSKDKWKLQGRKNRRLSWRECARLQGLPLKAKPGGGLLDKYRVIRMRYHRLWHMH
jgi:DNA (cytosine-5)-methyltransferase 1